MPARRSKQNTTPAKASVVVAVATAAKAVPSKSKPVESSAAQAPKPRLRRNGPVHVRDLHQPNVVHVLTSTTVVHLPSDFAADGRLYLCSAFNTKASCHFGESCPNVHATIDSAAPPPTYVAHERNASWNTLADVSNSIKFFDAHVGVLDVAAPNAKAGDATRPVDARKCLATSVLESERKPISHCAHFRAKGVCDLGAKCAFVHALDDLADAPPPLPQHPLTMPAFTESVCDDDEVQMGDTSVVSTAGCRRHDQHRTATPVGNFAVSSLEQTTLSTPGKAYHRDAASSSSTVLLPRARHHHSISVASPSGSYTHNPYAIRSMYTASAASSVATSPPTSDHSNMQRGGPATGRFRRDPYSPNATPVWLKGSL